MKISHKLNMVVCNNAGILLEMKEDNGDFWMKINRFTWGYFQNIQRLPPEMGYSDSIENTYVLTATRSIDSPPPSPQLSSILFLAACPANVSVCRGRISSRQDQENVSQEEVQENQSDSS